MKPAAYVCETGTFMSEVEAVSSFHTFLSGLGLFLTVVEIVFTIGIYWSSMSGFVKLSA